MPVQGNSSPRPGPAERSGPVRLEGLDAIRGFVHARVQEARRRLWILSPGLEPVIYDDPELADAVSRLARRSRHSDVRILIQDSHSLPTGGHRLVDLALRMSSRIPLRRHAPGESALGEAMLLVDAAAYLHQPRAGDPVAIADANAPPRVLTLEARYRTWWAHAVPDPELRRLKI